MAASDTGSCAVHLELGQPTYITDYNFRAILLATLRHVVQNHGRLSRNNPRLHRYLSSDYFRRKETKPAEKASSSSLFYKEEKQTRLVESSDSDIKSWSQILLRKVQKRQQNMLSTSLKVKKVTSRLSDLVLRNLN